ncbi:MAG: hypothetical protein LBG76_04985 [Treponema sp.]|jgi:hypothetical protein|nr:hypothetical protein [Treponema sp.]
MGFIAIPLLSSLTLAVCFLIFESVELGFKFSAFQMFRRTFITVFLGSALWPFVNILIKSVKNIGAEIQKEAQTGFKLYRVCAGSIGLRLFGSILIWLYIVVLAASGIVYDIPMPASVLLSNRLLFFSFAGLILMAGLAFLVGNLIFVLILALNFVLGAWSVRRCTGNRVDNGGG